MDDDAVKPVGDEAIAALSGRISSWRDFADRVSAALAMAAADPVPLSLSDVDFTHWPLGQRSVMEAFHQWALHGNRLPCQLLAVRFDEMVRQHPRWVNWRGTWGHLVRCWQVPEELHSSVQPLLVLHDRLALRLTEPRLGVGLWTRDPATIKAWLLDFDVILQRSHEAMPSTTLGL
jgi:hypothetical protein